MARKVCAACNTRTVGTGPGSDPESAKSVGVCTTCYEEAGWDNTHSDEGHDNYGPDSPAGEAPEFMDRCWTCHPELNLAKDRTPAKAKEGHTSPRRTQLNHRTQCTHPQTPAARRACREAHWAEQAAETAAKPTAAPTPAKTTKKTPKPNYPAMEHALNAKSAAASKAK